MSVVYRTFKYVDSIDPDQTFRKTGNVNISMMDLPGVMHSSTYISVHSIDIPIPNRAGYKIPRQLRVYCSTPTTAQGEDGYNNVLLQIYPAMHVVSIPGAFSVISYRDLNSGSSTALQVLDPQFSSLRLTLTDGSDNLFVPEFPLDIILKIELIRNYEAEQLEQLVQLVRKQELALVQKDLLLQSKLNRAPPVTYASADDIYGPLDNTALYS